jgi:hypothetical protein
MADQHLTALSSPEFPQVFDGSLDRLFERVDRIYAASLLSTCDFEDQYGDCREVATVHHLASEHEFCERHFAVVNRKGVSRG